MAKSPMVITHYGLGGCHDYSCWTSLGFFARLTRRRLKRGVFRSHVDPQVAINRFLAETNSTPKPFVWTADPKRVLAAVKRGKEALESIQ